MVADQNLRYADQFFHAFDVNHACMCDQRVHHIVVTCNRASMRGCLLASRLAAAWMINNTEKLARAPGSVSQFHKAFRLPELLDHKREDARDSVPYKMLKEILHAAYSFVPRRDGIGERNSMVPHIDADKSSQCPALRKNCSARYPRLGLRWRHHEGERNSIKCNSRSPGS